MPVIQPVRATRSSLVACGVLTALVASGCIDWNGARERALGDGGVDAGPVIPNSDGGPAVDGGTVLPDGGGPVPDGGTVDAGSPRLCTASTWCFAHPTPLPGALYALTAANGRLFAVGDHSALAEWKGGGWSGLIEQARYPLRGVYARNDHDIWAVGLSGQTLHYGGTVWTEVAKVGSPPPQLNAVWAPPTGTRAWAVGLGGNILSWSGSAWSPESSLITTGLDGISGTSESDVWAVGEAGKILHRDATTWGSVFSPTGKDLHAVVVGASSGFAVGDSGTVLFWSGNAWSGVVSGTSYPLRAVSVSGSEAWIVGDHGTVLHWTGTALVPVAINTYLDLQAVQALSSTDVWMVGTNGATFHFDGASIQNVVAANNLTDWSLNAVWASSATNAWAVGGAGTFMHWDGSAWSLFPTGVSIFQRAVSGTAPNDVWALGDDAMHFDGSSWSVSSGGVGPGGAAIAAVPGGDAWVVGTDLIRQRVHGSGAWISVPVGLSKSWTAVSGTASDDVWVVAADGTIVHWNGTALVQVASGTTFPLSSVWAFSRTDAWAVGERGPIDTSDTVIHWDGVSWSPRSTGFAASLTRVSGSAANDVYAAGRWHSLSDEILFHWNGSAWAMVFSAEMGTEFKGLAVVPGAAWVTGDSALILDHRP